MLKGLGTFKKITNMDIDKAFLTELFKQMDIDQSG